MIFMFKKISRRDWINIIIIIILNVLPRLVYFLNKGFFIDGDEAIFGSMVKELVNNGHLSLFFPGQSYGFVFFEVLTAGLISFLFGANIFTLKIAMLLFWLASMITLYFLGKKLLASRQWALLAVLSVSSIPVWFDWASKARGGYLTALFLSLIITSLVFCKRNTVRIMAVSISLALIYYSQPLWLIIVSPFVAYYFLKSFNIRSALTAVAGLFLSFASLEAIFRIAGFHYQAQNKLGLDHIGANFQSLLHNLGVAYSGKFFDVAAAKIGSIIAINAAIFVFLLLLAVAYNLYLLVIKKIKISSLLFMLAVVLYMVFMLFYNDPEFSYRYLLPLFLPGMILIVLTVKNLPSPGWRFYLKIFLILFAAFSLLCGACSYNYIFAQPHDDYSSEVGKIGLLKKYLNDNQVVCAYTMDWIVSQHLNYFIGDIVNRSREPDPRRPADYILTDRLYRQGADCALVGLWYQMPAFVQFYGLQDTMIIGRRYIVYLHPRRDDLLKLGFKLPDTETGYPLK